MTRVSWHFLTIVKFIHVVVKMNLIFSSPPFILGQSDCRLNNTD